MADIYCDNFATCRSMRLEVKTEQETLDRARAAGWHIWSGVTLGGADLTVTLCPGCVNGKATRIPRSQPLEGDQPLF